MTLTGYWKPHTHAREERGGGAGWQVGHVRAHGSGLCACESSGHPAVEEVQGAAEGEGIVRGLFPEDFERVDRLSMGEDVK